MGKDAQRSISETRRNPNEFTEEFSMGSFSILGSIQALDAQHLRNIADSDLIRIIAGISSAKPIAAVAAHADNAQSRIQRHSGQTKRALLKRGGPASVLDFCAEKQYDGKRTLHTFFAKIRFTSDDKQQEPSTWQ
jgi:hypothetical protein